MIDSGGLALTTTRAIVAGRLVSTTDARGQVTTYEHDARGNAVVAVGPNGATTRLTYDADGRVSRTTTPYDANGSVTGETVSSPAGSEARTTRWTYDAAGRVLTVTDAAGRDDALRARRGRPSGG